VLTRALCYCFSLQTRGVRVILGDRIAQEKDEKTGAGSDEKAPDGAPTFHTEGGGDEKKAAAADEKKSDETLVLKAYKTSKGETIEADFGALRLARSVGLPVLAVTWQRSSARVSLPIRNSCGRTLRP
jgi:hypothetical protein